MKNQTGQRLVSGFKPVVTRYGAPVSISSDNCLCYISKQWQELIEQHLIIHNTSSPHYSESNGLAERGVPTTGEMWKREEDKNGMPFAYKQLY